MQTAFDEANAVFSLGLPKITVKLADMNGAGFCRPLLGVLALSRKYFRGGVIYDLVNLVEEMHHMRYPASGHGGAWLRGMNAIGVEHTPHHCDKFYGWHAVQPGGQFDVWSRDFMWRYGIAPQIEAHDSQKDDAYRAAEAKYKEIKGWL
jgi:hypothetical protein